MKEGRRAGGLTGRKRRRTSSAILFCFFFLVISHLIDQYTSE
jgi:hypothetical protein